MLTAHLRELEVTTITKNWTRVFERSKSFSMKSQAHEIDDSDLKIILAILDGETERYAELVDKYQEKSLYMAFSFLGNYEDAKDVSQDAFVSAYKALGRFRAGSKFSTWLYRIVVNKCKDVYRKRSRVVQSSYIIGTPDSDESPGLFIEVDDDSIGPSEIVSNRELALAISKAVETLPLKQRTAFVLHHIHGLSLEEVSGIMHCRVGTVKSHVFRSVTQMRNHLSPWLAQEGL